MEDCQTEIVPVKILLLEDSEDDFQDLEALLSSMKGISFTLEWAQDFDDGLRALKEKAYDVCLLDSTLGPRGGIEFIREAKAQGNEVPIIMLSESGNSDQDLTALRAGADDYLIKGKIHPTFLRRAVKHALARRRSKREANALQKQLMHAQRMESFGQLAAGLAQDLCNVLAGIVGHLDLIKMNAQPDSQTARSSETALQGCKRAAFLTEQVMACYRRENSAMGAINLQQIVLETVDFLSRLLPKNIAATTTVDRSDELIVSGDPSLIRQALINLSMNAKESMPEGGSIHYRISSHFVDNPPRSVPAARAGRYARLDVSDTGNGITDLDMDKIFDPGFTTKEGTGGVGFGLATVYSIMQHHDGWVDVDSKIGKGCTFSLFFPLSARMVDYPQETLQHPVRSKGLILAVDDDAALAELMKLYLAAAGYTAKVFSSPGEAIAWYSSHAKEVDLILLDMVMSGISGKECFEIFRKIRSDARIAVFSADADKDVQELLKQGAVKFFQKPARYPLIITWVAELLNGG